MVRQADLPELDVRPILGPHGDKLLPDGGTLLDLRAKVFEAGGHVEQDERDGQQGDEARDEADRVLLGESEDVLPVDVAHDALPVVSASAATRSSAVVSSAAGAANGTGSSSMAIKTSITVSPAMLSPVAGSTKAGSS